MVELERQKAGLRVRDGSEILGCYRADPEVPRHETPKPYWHPLSSLAGHEITGLRPADHTWHHGLQFGVPKVGETNLWGGNTYTPESGYTLLNDHGVIEHQGWTFVRNGYARSSLTWRAVDGSSLIEETREFTITDQRPEMQGWTLRWETHLRLVADSPQTLRTPAQLGRSGGAYAGLFLRGAAGLVWRRWVLDPKELDRTVEGSRAEQLLVHATIGDHPLTLLASDSSDEPVHWLIRDGDFSALCWSPLYYGARQLEPGEGLQLRHELTIVDGLLAPSDAFDAWPESVDHRSDGSDGGRTASTEPGRMDTTR